MGAAASAGYYDPGVARTRDEWLSLLGKAVVSVEDSFRSLDAEARVASDGGLTLSEIAERGADPSSAPPAALERATPPPAVERWCRERFPRVRMRGYTCAMGNRGAFLGWGLLADGEGRGVVLKVLACGESGAQFEKLLRRELLVVERLSTAAAHGAARRGTPWPFSARATPSTR